MNLKDIQSGKIKIGTSTVSKIFLADTQVYPASSAYGEHTDNDYIESIYTQGVDSTYWRFPAWGYVNNVNIPFGIPFNDVEGISFEWGGMFLTNTSSNSTYRQYYRIVGSENNSIAFCPDNSWRWAVCRGTTTTFVNVTHTLNQRYTAKIQCLKGSNNCKVWFNGALKGTLTYNPSSNGALSNTMQPLLWGGNQRLYYVKMYDHNGILQRDLIPAIYNNEYGLWDRINGVFYAPKASFNTINGVYSPLTGSTNYHPLG